MSCNSKTVTLDRRNTTLPRPAAYSVNTGLRAPMPETLADPSQLLRLLRDYYDAIKQASGAIHPSRIPQLKSMALPNYAELRATVGDAQGNAGPRAVIVAGRTLPLDGGEGVFAWSPDSVETDDDDTVIQVPGVGVGRWIKMLSALSETARNTYYAQNIWYVNPVSGNDRRTGLNGEALRTVSEVARRTAGATYSGDGTVTVFLLGDTAATDIPVWSVVSVNGHDGVKITGVLGLTSVLDGSVTGVQSIAGTTSGVTNDYWIEDSAIPVSWTASGALVDGLAFKRTSGTECWWFAAKDKGSKQLRVSCPLNLSNSEVSLSGGDTYALYRQPRLGSMVGIRKMRLELELCALSSLNPSDLLPWSWFEVPEEAVLDRCSLRVRYQFRYSTSATNCRFVNVTAPATAVSDLNWQSGITGGLAIGGYDLSCTSHSLSTGSAAPMVQSGTVTHRNGSDVNRAAVRIYDATGSYAFSFTGGSQVKYLWISGSGNTCTKLAQVRQGAAVKYDALPPSGFNSNDTWEIAGDDFSQATHFGVKGISHLTGHAAVVLGG